MRKLCILYAALALIVPFLFCGCSGDDGAQGPAGAPGGTGGIGPPGTGTGAAAIDTRHGGATLAAEELADFDKYPVDVTITGATADAAGVVTVNFTVMNGTQAVTAISSVSAGIFKLVPKGSGFSYNRWVPYIWRAETVVGTQDNVGNSFPMPADTTVNQGYRESSGTGATNGTLVNNGGGSYTYTFKKNLAAATLPSGGGIAYDRTLTHRVSIYAGGHNGPTGEGDFDFVPNGSAVTETRNIVETATCKKCHGPEFAGHGGDRVTVEGCVACHSPDSKDAQSGESIEMAVMIHKIHAGNELASVAGVDGKYYDNPWTEADETADNGRYILWGHSTTPVSWEGAAFPAVLANCQACHTGGAANVDNWKTVPSRAACGSCHDTIVWATGVNHAGGAASSDDLCAACHPATGASSGKPVTEAHDWTKKDIRNIPEFDITLTVDTPSRGYYINGERPVVTLVLKDHFTGATIDHTTVSEDVAAEGCIPKTGFEGTECTVPRDGLFRAANVYVVGPRAQKGVNLTYAARATVRSATAGPWDLSAGGGSLKVKVDSGMTMLAYKIDPVYEGYGADELISGDITVTLPAAGAALNALFANPAAATAAEVAAWLNANATFKERAFAYVDEALPGHANAGKLAIRSRGVSKKNSSGDVIETTTMRNIQIISGLGGVFTDTAIRTAGGADSVRKMTTANATNPKAVFSAANIQYTLDPVDDLVPGTYIVHVEYGDAGRAPAPANPAEPPYVDYRTPSVAITTFNVKTDKLSATKKGADGTEKPVAGNCTACHWSSAGTGFVLDNPRHNKIFDEKATDRCGGCHDYTPGSGMVSTATTQQIFEGSLSKRVHAVHNGSALNYPTITVGHEETSAFGRNWRITYPMNIRNCESCHPATTTSGTWTTNPNRLACMGCHDSDAATAHMKANTFDPTPLVPWSGDERESCKTCH